MNILYYSWNEVMAQDITDTLKDMGIEKVIDAYQTAYDRYMQN